MSCRNKKYDSSLDRVIDLDVVYTGCGSVCYGEEIKAGMTLRAILDVILSNCGEGVTSWGEIIGNIEDQTDLVQFIEENIQSVTWGNITGDITDQEDLVSYIEENGLPATRVGSNLHILDIDNTLNAGVPVFPENPEFRDIYDVIAINPNKTPIQPEDVGSWSKGLLFLENKADPSQSQVFFGSLGILEMTFPTIAVKSQEVVLAEGNHEFFRGTPLQTVLGSDISTNSTSVWGKDISIGENQSRVCFRRNTNGNVNITTIPGANIALNAPQPSGSTGTVSNITLVDGNVELRQMSELRDIYIGLNAGSFSRGVGMRTVTDSSGPQIEACFELQGWDGASQPSNFINPFFRYRDGMPRPEQISDNVLPTIGYIRDTIVAEAMAPLMQQISDLEARVSALEGA